jgi:hypothetical protein
MALDSEVPMKETNIANGRDWVTKVVIEVLTS